MKNVFLQQWKKIRQKEGLACGSNFFLILLYIQLHLQMGWGDDVWFAQNNESLVECVVYRYRTWSSRVLIEAGVLLMTAMPDWVWRMLNILIILLLVWIVSDLFGIERNGSKIQAKILFFALMWVVPTGCINEVGWIATTMNYLWPLTLGLVAARPVKHWIREEKCPMWEYIVCPLCLLCGANMEQVAALLWGGIYCLEPICSEIKRSCPSSILC